MATDGASAWLNTDDDATVEYPAASLRQLDSVLLAPGADPFSSRGGRAVGADPGLTVTVSGSPLAWAVSPGAGVIYDPDYSNQGPYRFAIAEAVSADMPSAPATSQSRIDLIVARQYDDQIGEGTTGQREVKIERVPGTAGTSPSTPTKPALSQILATLTVPHTGTVTVTPNPDKAVAAGGVLPVGTTTERDALAGYTGQVVYNGQTSQLEVYNGSIWAVPVYDSGWIDWTPTGVVTSAWTVSSAKYRKFGPMVEIYVRIVRAGGLYDPDSSGNFVSDSVLWTGGLPAEACPTSVSAELLWNAHGIRSGGWYLQSDGGASMTHAFSNAGIGTGQGIGLRGVYMVGL